MFEIPNHAPETEAELEEMLSRPNDRVYGNARQNFR